jgi:hypothetical protein
MIYFLSGLAGMVVCLVGLLVAAVMVTRHKSHVFGTVENPLIIETKPETQQETVSPYLTGAGVKLPAGHRLYSESEINELGGLIRDYIIDSYAAGMSEQTISEALPMIAECYDDALKLRYGGTVKS